AGEPRGQAVAEGARRAHRAGATLRRRRFHADAPRRGDGRADAGAVRAEHRAGSRRGARAARAVRIAIVRQRYNPYGGAERFVARALPALERGGAEVTLISRSAEGWGARRVERVDPFYLGSLWRDWAFARAARAAWRRLGFDVVQSHERIPGCDLYRAGDGVHRRWLELRGAAAGLL